MKAKISTAGMLLCLFAVAGTLFAQAPSWWDSQEVLTTNDPYDYAPVNQGQLKWLASRAAEEFALQYPGTGNSNILALVDSFTFSNNYAPVNLGQLKTVALPFYNRLIELGITNTYPWTSSTNTPNDYGLANIGQVKYLFAFTLSNILEQVFSRNWLYHNNTNYADAFLELVPGKDYPFLSVDYATGTNTVYYLAPSQLTANADYTTMMQLRYTYQNPIDDSVIDVWTNAEFVGNIVLETTNAFHGEPVSTINTVLLYRAQWSLPSLNGQVSVWYSPFIKVIDQNGTQIDYTYLLERKRPGDIENEQYSTNNWLISPQLYGPDFRDRDFFLYHDPAGLRDGGFEDGQLGSISNLNYWSVFEDTAQIANFSIEGEQALCFSGGDAVWQNIGVLPGSVYSLSAKLYTPAGTDQLSNGKQIRLGLEFFDRNGTNILTDELICTESTLPSNSWFTIVITGTVPAHARSANVVVNTLNGGTGMVYIDSVEWQVEPLVYSGPVGDIDNDGLPDEWEKNYAGLVIGLDDSLGDPDNDGLNNLQEYNFGSNPFVSDVFFVGEDGDDADIGSYANPFATVQHACDLLPVNGGLVLLKNGTYTENATVPGSVAIVAYEELQVEYTGTLTITGNHAKVYGIAFGGTVPDSIIISNCSGAVVSNVCISNSQNTAIHVFNANATIVDSRIQHNTQYGIHADNSVVEILNCLISSNSQSGMLFENASLGTLTDTVVEYHKYSNYDAGIEIESFSQVCLTNCTLQHNGFAIRTEFAKLLKMRNCIIQYNSNRSIEFRNPSGVTELDAAHCVFAYNGSYVFDFNDGWYAQMRVVNSIFWRNPDCEDLPDGINPFYSCDLYSEAVLASEQNNFYKLYHGWRETDYHLRADSPLINKGQNVDYVDIDHEARPFNDRPDIGVDEFVDSDSDGMPDWWEGNYQLDAEQDDSLNDADGDGKTNIHEYEAGENPWVSNAYECIYVEVNGDDSGNGTYTNPVQTITRALELIEADKRIIKVGAGEFASELISIEYTNNVTIQGAGKTNTVLNSKVYIKVSDKITIRDCTIQDDELLYNGGIYMDYVCDVSLENTIIRNHDGREIYVQGNKSLLTARNCEFSESIDHVGMSVGGSIYLYDCRIFANDENGISIGNSGIYLSNCKIVNNQNNGIEILNSKAHAYLKNCCIIGNGSWGIRNKQYCNVNILDCLIIENGSGIQSVSGSTLNILHSIVLSNQNAGISISQVNDGLLIANSIIWGNAEAFAGDEEDLNDLTASIQGCDIQDGLWNGTNFNISIVPAWQDAANSNYHITADSLFIDRGVRLERISSDVDGDTRPYPDYGFPDIGIDEVRNADSDKDRLPDWWEISVFGDLLQNSESDCDGDGLSNLEEYIYRVDPANSDTDADSIIDSDEIFIYGTNPLNTDTDNDSMPDSWEIRHKLDPLDPDNYFADTDGDSIPNLWECVYETEPTNHLSFPLATVIVATNGTGDFVTLQAAYDAANDLDIIEVYPGVYSGLDAYGTNRIVWLAGSNQSGERVLIQAGNNNSVVQYADTVMAGFVITHEEGKTGSGVYLGKHPDLAKNPVVRLNNCGIYGNTANSGAAVYNRNAHLELQHCSVFGNQSTSRELLYNSGYEGVKTRIVNSIIWNNDPDDDELVSSGQYTVSNSIVRGGQFGGLDVDPQLMPGGWMLTNSPAYKFGNMVIRDDVHGESRLAKVDLGWDEFTDTDSDGLPDWWEVSFFGDLLQNSEGDYDGDGLANNQEYSHGTDPKNQDTDGDGLNDGDEVFIHGTDALNYDTDNDDISDGWESSNGMDPFDQGDRELDPDNDGYVNLCEFYFNTDPNNENSYPVVPYLAASIINGYIPIGTYENMFITLLTTNGDSCLGSYVYTVKMDGGAIFTDISYTYGTGTRDENYNRLFAVSDTKGRLATPVTALHPGSIGIMMEQFESDCFSTTNRPIYISSIGLAYVQPYEVENDWLRLSISESISNESVSLNKLCSYFEPNIPVDKRPVFNIGEYIFTNISVYRNGYISVDGDKYIDPDETNISNVTEGVIIPFLNDLYMSPKSQIFVHYQSDMNARCVIEWHKMGLSDDHEAEITFQMHMFNTNVLPRFVFKEVIAGTNATALDSSLIGMNLGGQLKHGISQVAERYTGYQIIYSNVVYIPAMLSDGDSDGLDNEKEWGTGTSPYDPDSNADGMSDGWKYLMDLDPLSAAADNGPLGDPDNDGYPNIIEFHLYSNPRNPCSPICSMSYTDQNRNGMDDQWETDNSVTGEPLDDPDCDGFNNLQEYLLNQSPLNQDGVVTNALYQSI